MPTPNGSLPTEICVRYPVILGNSTGSTVFTAPGFPDVARSCTRVKSEVMRAEFGYAATPLAVPSSVIRVGGVAQPITKEIEREDGDDNAGDGKHQPRVKRDDVNILSFV